jgi:hypothetical protein
MITEKNHKLLTSQLFVTANGLLMASHISELIHDATLLREIHSHKTQQGGVYIYHTTLFLTIQCPGIHES